VSLQVHAPTAAGEGNIRRPQLSGESAAPAAGAKGIVSRLRAFMRKGMENDILHVLGRLVRPGDRVLEITASPRSYAHGLANARVETVHVDASQLASGDSVAGMLRAHDRSEPYDIIFLQGIVSYASDIQQLLAALRPWCAPDTRLVLLSYNALWQPLLQIANALGMRKRTPDENWLSSHDVNNLLLLADLDLVGQRRRVLVPAGIPLFTALANRFLSALPVVTWLGLCDWYVARTAGAPRPEGKVSVVVPARNEAGNIARILDEMPEMGTGVEVIFVEGGSSDDTWETIEREKERYRGHAEVRLLKQKGKGKKDASFLGFDAATGDYLMIFDADVTVPPSDLPKFYEALRSGKGEFINGTRLVYPLHKGAMRFLNLIANRFFAIAFSFILGQQLKDTLCGTKVLSRKSWQRLVTLREEFAGRDPFGDFDLLFGAARLQLKIVEVPIRYQARTYGTTNISRFSHGWMLLKMCVWGLRSLKFV
jgi:hypothetical protein